MTILRETFILLVMLNLLDEFFDTFSIRHVQLITSKGYGNKIFAE